MQWLGASYDVKTGAVVTKEATPLNEEIKLEVMAEWRKTGRAWSTLQLLMEVKKRQNAQAATAQEGV